MVLKAVRCYGEKVKSTWAWNKEYKHGCLKIITHRCTDGGGVSIKIPAEKTAHLYFILLKHIQVIAFCNKIVFTAVGVAVLYKKRRTVDIIFFIDFINKTVKQHVPFQSVIGGR